MSSDSSKSVDQGSEEWGKARDVLDKFDERLHDIRKIGFSFITGLLSVSALFATATPGSWKLGALIAILMLIVALDLVDRNYRVIMSAAAIDAQLIERRSEMNLTQTISRIYDTAHVRFYFETVYITFSLATLLLGWFVLGGFTDVAQPYYLVLLIAVAIVIYVFSLCVLYPGLSKWGKAIIFALAVVLALGLIHNGIGALISVILPGGPPHHYYHTALIAMVTIATVAILIIESVVDVRPWVDLAIDKYEYEQGEKIVAVVTNIGPESLKLDFGNTRPALTVQKEEHEDITQRVKKNLRFTHSRHTTIRMGSAENWRMSWSDHRWEFSTKHLSQGLYRVVYNGPIYLREYFPIRWPTDPYPYRLCDDVSKLEKPKYDPWKVAQRFRVTKSMKTPEEKIILEDKRKATRNRRK